MRTICLGAIVLMALAVAYCTMRAANEPSPPRTRMEDARYFFRWEGMP